MPGLLENDGAMPPTSTHEDDERTELGAEVFSSLSSSQADGDAAIVSDAEAGTNPLSDTTSRRSADRVSLVPHGGEDEIDGPLSLGPDNKHEIPSRNEFGSRKIVAQALMDFALFTANISQLRVLLAATEADTQFYIPVLVLIITSISCQVIFAILIFIIWVREKPKKDLARNSDETERNQVINDVTTQRVHMASVAMVYLIVVTNSFITGLGIEPENKDK